MGNLRKQEQLKVTAPAVVCTMVNFNKEARACRYNKELSYIAANR